MPSDPAPKTPAQIAAVGEFKRMMLWIAGIAVVMVIASLWGLSRYMTLTPPMVLAVVGGVFFSVLLGSGLFAAAFFSNKSGHDQSVSDAGRRPGEG